MVSEGPRPTALSAAAGTTCLFCGGALTRADGPCPHCGCSKPFARTMVAPLTGREREIALLHEHIDRVRAGQGGFVGIAGEAGIGKSRLAEQALAYAKAQGCFDFFMRGFEPSAAVPYWTLIEALQFDAITGAALALAPGVPELIDALRGAQEAPRGATAGFEAHDPGVSARVYSGLITLLRSLTASRPLVVIVDDLQWVDLPTLNLMRYQLRLAKSLPVLTICTYRDDGEGSAAWRPVLEDAAREGLLAELRLEGLGEGAARRLARSIAPEPLSDRALEQALRLAEGNPFYIAQLAHAFALAPREGRPALPAALRGFTEQRLAGLSSACRALVQVVALAGRACPLDLLAVISAMPLPDLATALDEALTAHVLVERGAAASPQYDVSHALLREAAAHDINALARAALQLRIADALHARRTAGGRVPAGEVAGHYLDARPLAPSEITLAYAREAADEALSLGAPDQAARFLEAAVELLAAQGPAAAEETARLRVRLLEAHGRAGDTAASEREATAVLAYFRAQGDARAQADVHALLAEQLNPRLRPRDVAAAADAGLALLGAERTPLAARLRYLRAHALHMLDDSSELLPVADWLAAGGFDPPEPAAELWARLLRILWHIWSTVDAAAGTGLCREAVATARGMGDRRAEALALLWQAQVQAIDARPREALATLDRARVLAREAGSTPMLVDADALRVEALLQLGRWDELEQTVDETLPVLLRLRSTYFGYTMLAAHAWSRRLRGLPWTPPHGLELSFHESPSFGAGFRADLARHVVEFGRADDRTGRLIDWLVANVPPSGGLAWGMAGVPLLGVLAFAGRRGDISSRLEGVGGLGRFTLYASFAPLDLARAETLLKRWEAAEAHFDQAARLATEEGLQLALARTLLERGAMYRQRGRRGDRARAAAVLERAAALCEALGLVPDRDRARRLLADLGPVAPPTLPAGLTPREAEVLRLLAAGRMNREIADDLTISEKTVEQHLLNIYQKLQVTSRAQAVAFAFAHHLLG